MMKYVVSFESAPKVYEEVFALWDSKYDVGYDWFSFDEMIEDVSIFDTVDAAINYACEVLQEVFFDELYIIAVNEDEDTKCVYTVR